MWTNLSLDLSQNPTNFPDELVRSFIQSPFEPTLDFVNGFEPLCLDKRLNPMFLIESTNTHLLPLHVLEHCIVVAQRSEEWLRLLTYYSCGKNSGIKKYEGLDWVRFYYNLIRGAIMEIFVIKYCDFSNLIKEKYEKITIGFLVDDIKMEKSLAISPDLILLTESGKIIPVEIKCMTSKPVNNRAFRRSVKLARKQLETSINILKDSKVGIIVIIYIYLNDANFIVYDTQASLVNF